jgi:hypothetical protein
MTYFLCKMILPRSDFIQTMTDSERNIMRAHGDYLQSLAEVGSIVCHGPVDDPKGWVGAFDLFCKGPNGGRASDSRRSDNSR